MSLVKSGRGEERIFRCPSHKAHKIFLKKDSFWESSHLKFKQIVELLFLWAFKIPVSTANDLVDVSEKTIVQWFAYFRDICTNNLVNNPYRIGGPGVIVEIDESLVAKRKNNVGHVVEQRWVFGDVCPATGQGFLTHIADKSAATLLPLIMRYVEPGSIIHSDGLPSYNNIATLPVNPPYQHLVVNHNRNFVDPVTGACTNHVECYWKNCKRRFRVMAGVHNSTLDSHLDEFMWREIHGKTGEDALNNILLHLSQWYPLP
ncbi:hypothetical protein PoB_004643200 [Plakobranchus ocellatus]|uniref:ISXO2-like transposase domain-containing protein n=1 Tax=Plakobranchus ocellatus TaxID=259542 RepID=A0AAV4BKU3_9GAST|nr:hypothetical protein PoB_004643200 [Plakobranchus ocellatus]